MRPADDSIEDARRRLEQEFAALRRQWDSTRSAWRDDVAERFEKQFWTPIQDETERYLRAARDVEDALRKANTIDR